MKNTEWVPAEKQPTYTPGEEGVTVTPVPTLTKKLKKKEKDKNDPRTGTHKR